MAVGLVLGGAVLGGLLGAGHAWYGSSDDSYGFFEEWTPGPSEPLERATVEPVEGEPGTWLVMMYVDADDEILEEESLFNMNEAELVGSTDAVKVAAQLDRYPGGYTGDGDATGTCRYLLTKDGDLFTLASPVLEDLGEVDMSDPQTLYDFLLWAIGAYPAERHALIMSDHGMGWAGGWFDEFPAPGGYLSAQQIDEVLSAAVADTGIEALELVGMDACLMAQLEVMSALAPHARYAVASEEMAPTLGWSYASMLEALNADPSMTGEDLGRAIVRSYICEDVRLTDDGARRQMMEDDSTLQEAVEYFDCDTTMAAIDLGQIDEVVAALNDLALALTAAEQRQVAKARTYAWGYLSPFGTEDPNELSPPSSVDLASLVDMLEVMVDEPSVGTAGKQVKEALSKAVVAERRGELGPGSSGLSLYFPEADEYEYSFAGYPDDYAPSVGRFAAASLWDDYLTYHYAGDAVDAGTADVRMVTAGRAQVTDFSAAAKESWPERGNTWRGPGAGYISIAPLELTATSVQAGDSVVMSTDVTGENTARIYYYVACYSEERDLYISVDGGQVEPPRWSEVGGVEYPDWGSGRSVSVQQEWTSSAYYLSNGERTDVVFAFLPPSTYGFGDYRDYEDGYYVFGMLKSAETGDDVFAQMYFDEDGQVESLWGYTSDGYSEYLTWHELDPRRGGTFTVTNEFVKSHQGPSGETVAMKGGTVTFGSTPPILTRYAAPAGKYVVGIGVEDSDGDFVWQYAELTIIE